MYVIYNLTVCDQYCLTESFNRPKNGVTYLLTYNYCIVYCCDLYTYPTYEYVFKHVSIWNILWSRPSAKPVKHHAMTIYGGVEV
jgi:hypothetical protein